MAARRKGPPEPTLEDVPVTELEALRDRGITDIYVLLKRKCIPAGIETLRGFDFRVEGLLSDELTTFLAEQYGGGTYILDVSDATVRSNRLCSRFKIIIPGAPKLGTSASKVQPGLPHSPLTEPAYPRNPAPGIHPNQIWQHTPDQLALAQAQEAKQELADFKREAAEKERAANRRIESILADNQKLRDSILSTQQQAKEDSLRSELKRMEETLKGFLERKPEKQGLDLTALAAIFGAIAPIFQTAISTGSTKHQLLLESQKHSAEQNQNLLLTLFKKDDKHPPPDPLKQILELVVGLGPVVKEIFVSRSPDKIGEMIASMNESQMTTMHMAVQAIQAMMPEPESPGMQMVHAFIQGWGEVNQQRLEAAQGERRRMAAAQRERQFQPRQRQQVQPQQQIDTSARTEPMPEVEHPQATNGRRVRPAPGTQPPLQQVVDAEIEPELPQSPQELAQYILDNPAWPGELSGPGWLEILTALHSDAPPAQIGGEIASIVQALYDDKVLPAEVTPVIEDESIAPSAIFRQIFGTLPIAQAHQLQHFNAILAAIDAAFAHEEQEEPQQPIADA